METATSFHCTKKRYDYASHAWPIGGLVGEGRRKEGRESVRRWRESKGVVDYPSAGP